MKKIFKGHCIHDRLPDKCDNCKIVITYSLDADQYEKLRQWQTQVKALMGEYGQFDYTFSPTGIGCGVTVYSHLIKKSLDLTDVSKW